MPLERWYNPLCLHFSGADIDEATFAAAMRESPGVCHVNVINTSLTEDHLQPVLQARETLRLISIESLSGDVPPFRITDRGAEALSQLPQLRVMSLLGCELDFAPRRHVPACGGLDALYLDGSVFAEETFSELMKEWSFTTLSLRCRKFTPQMAAALAQQRGLEKLFLSEATFELDSLHHLAPLEKLTEIRLMHTGVDDQAIAQVQKFLPESTVCWIDRY